MYGTLVQGAMCRFHPPISARFCSQTAPFERPLRGLPNDAGLSKIVRQRSAMEKCRICTQSAAAHVLFGLAANKQEGARKVGTERQ